MPGSSSQAPASLVGLIVGGVYILLFVRSDPPLLNDFHWALYVHTKQEEGYKYHIKNIGAGWIADHGAENGVFKAFLLIVLFHIATVNVETRNLDLIDGIMRTYDTNLNTPGITCRTWVLRNLDLLRANHMLECTDLRALELEIFDFGNEHALDAARAKQPRPVGSSKICGGR